MTESIPNPESEKQVELLNQQLKEKQRLADLEEWKIKEEEIRKELAEKHTREKWANDLYNQKVASRNAPQLTPTGMKPDPNLGLGWNDERIRSEAEKEAIQAEIRYINNQKKEFLQELQETRENEAKAEQQRIVQEQERGKALDKSHQDSLALSTVEQQIQRYFRSSISHDHQKYGVLQETEQNVAAKMRQQQENLPTKTNDETLDSISRLWKEQARERCERNRDDYER